MVGSAYFVKSTPLRALTGHFQHFADMLQIYRRCAWRILMLNCCRTCFNMGDLGVQVSICSSIRPSTFTLGVLCLSFSDVRFYESVETVGTLWAQLLIQFIPIFMKLCTCFPHGLDICMWFGYNFWINFCHFFHFVNFVIFWPQILWKYIDNGYLVSVTPYKISCLSLCNFAHLFFFHSLKMCMWFGFNHAVIFCHFSTLLTL